MPHSSTFLTFMWHLLKWWSHQGDVHSRLCVNLHRSHACVFRSSWIDCQDWDFIEWVPAELWASAFSTDHVSAHLPQHKTTLVHKARDVLWQPWQQVGLSTAVLLFDYQSNVSYIAKLNILVYWHFDLLAENFIRTNLSKEYVFCLFDVTTLSVWPSSHRQSVRPVNQAKFTDNLKIFVSCL